MGEIINTDGDFFIRLKQIEREILESKDDPQAKECLRLIDEEEERFQREYEEEMALA
jgi:hypothetical protein